MTDGAGDPGSGIAEARESEGDGAGSYWRTHFRRVSRIVSRRNGFST